MQQNDENSNQGEIGPDDTPWSMKWTDQDQRDLFEIRAREYFELYKELRRESFRAHVDYGKWLIATFVAVHGGALFALNTLRSTGPVLQPDKHNLLLEAASWHVAGIVLILVAGFMGWLNFGYAAQHYDRWAEPAMLRRIDLWPKDDAKRNPIGATYWLALCAGLGSGFSLVAGAAAAIKAVSLQ